MAFDSLADFVDLLEREGELTRIGIPLDPVLEVSELADREMKSPGGGKALLIENPTDRQSGRRYDFPVLINAYGSEKRMAMALGVESVEKIADALGSLMKAKPPTTIKETFKLLGQGLKLLHAKPKHTSSGSCKEVVHRLDQGDSFSLDQLPILKCWPMDGGRFLTLPIVMTRDPDTQERNWGMYRMQVYDPKTTGMHWQIHKVGARHGRRYYETGERMPVSVCLGGDPAYAFCATAPLPDGVDETLFAGYLRQKSVELVKCETNDIEVPANCDFVIEGYVDPKETRMEGPFGDHTGFYTLPDPYPVFHVTAITHRRNAIFPATIVGIPPMEDFYMGDASVRIFLPIFKLNFPEIVDLHLPPPGVFHNLVVVSIRKNYPYQAFKIMHGLWGMGQMMFSKIIVVVDEDVDVRNLNDVIFRLCANIDPQRDTIFTKGPADSLDHATPVANFGSKMGIDATRKIKGEGFERSWPPIIKMDDEVKRRMDTLFPK